MSNSGPPVESPFPVDLKTAGAVIGQGTVRGGPGENDLVVEAQGAAA
jgi:hypothetical protein